MSAELPGVEHVEDIVKELEKAVDVAQEATKGNLKTAKVILRILYFYKVDRFSYLQYLKIFLSRVF